MRKAEGWKCEGIKKIPSDEAFPVSVRVWDI